MKRLRMMTEVIIKEIYPEDLLRVLKFIDHGKLNYLRNYIDDKLESYNFHELLEHQGDVNVMNDLLNKWKMLKNLDNAVMSVIEQQLNEHNTY